MSAPSSPSARVQGKPSSYRNDLDGLRGIAIALVVVFHVYMGAVSGGVDVFLLLSGFFFTGALIRNAGNPKQSINPWWAIWRTIRRLLPALLLVLGTVTLAMWTVLPSLRGSELTAQLTASLLYFQNYELASQGAAYAAADIEVSPLQHLWSMSVQGQYYLGAILVVTLVAWACRRHPVDPGTSRPFSASKFAPALVPTMAVILVLLTVASFWRAIYMHNTEQSFNYYSTASRLWELTLGALLALITSKVVLKGIWRRIAAPIGLAMVLSTGWLLNGAALFPGPWALWPLIGAMLVIIAGGGNTWTARFLSSKPLLFFGRIAYALYLWHWPLLIAAAIYWHQNPPSWQLGTAVIAVSILLAWLTNRFVEQPLAQHRRRPSRIEPVWRNTIDQLRSTPKARLRAGGGVLCVLTFATLLAMQPIQQHRLLGAIGGTLNPIEYPGALAISDGINVPQDVKFKPNPDYIRDLWPRPAVDGCIGLSGEPADEIITEKRRTDETPCIYGDPNGEKTMVLVGGSHSEHWFTPLNETAKTAGYQLHVYLRQGCPATLSPIPDVGEVCVEWTESLVDFLEDLNPDVVVTTSTRPGSEILDYTPEGYQQFWDAVDDMGARIIGIRDNPWAYNLEGEQFSPTACLQDSRAPETMDTTEADTRKAFGGNGPTRCDISRDLVVNPVNEGDSVLAQYPGSLSLDFTDYFCDSRRCPAVIGNIYVYRDSNHITDEYMLTLSETMKRQMLPYLRSS